MVGYASHGNGLTGRLATAGEGDVEQPGRFLSIFKEQLIKITHAVEQQGFRVFCLDAQVLAHHGGMLVFLDYFGHRGAVYRI